MALLASKPSGMWLMCCITVANASSPAYFTADSSTDSTGSTCENLTTPKFTIISKADCEAAASELDVTWYPSQDHFDDRPYGCHRVGSRGIFEGIAFNSNPDGRDEQDDLYLVCRNYPEVAAQPWWDRNPLPMSRGTVIVASFGGFFVCQVAAAIATGIRSGRLDLSMRSSRRGDGAADACKDPEKRIPDLEAAEKRDGETLATEEEAHITDSVICHSPGTPKASVGLRALQDSLRLYRRRFAGLAPTLQGKVSKEEQNSDDPQTPTRAEPEADPDVFLAPTLQEKVSKEEQNSDDPPTPTTAEPGLDEDFFIALPSKPKSYSVNPILLTSPIASGDHSKEEQYSTFDLDLNSETSSQGSQVYCRTPSFSGNSSNTLHI
jgi:hypothetical protein